MVCKARQLSLAQLETETELRRFRTSNCMCLIVRCSVEKQFHYLVHCTNGRSKQRLYSFIYYFLCPLYVYRQNMAHIFLGIFIRHIWSKQKDFMTKEQEVLWKRVLWKNFDAPSYWSQIIS